MRAMVLRQIGTVGENSSPLQLVDLPDPVPGQGELLVRVAACGVCHTELDEIEGRVRPPRLPLVLGHEVVGRVVEMGDAVRGFQHGQRVGIGWIHSSTGGGDENLSPQFVATGCDVDGGYAELMTVPESYAYPIPEVFSDAEAAPLLCAGAIGYRALKLANLRDGDRLGLTGFGGSAHLVLSLARHLYPNSDVFVFAREARTREFACEIGAVWAGDTRDRSPERLHAVIDTTPAWLPVLEALSNLRPGGRLVINAIRKEDADREELASLVYQDHLWMEREIKSVANITHHDISEFLPIAAEIPIRPQIETYPLEEANSALADLKFQAVRGAKVLLVGR
ncbi:MAG: zinc-dependent alcohol dehydrogenase family protein [Verrucomicrobiales bacterium]